MSFKRSLLFSLVLSAGVLGCHRDRDPNMAGGARSDQTDTTGTATSTGSATGLVHGNPEGEFPGTSAATGPGGASAQNPQGQADDRSPGGTTSSSDSAGVTGSDPATLPPSSRDYRDPRTPGPIGGDRGAPMSGGQVVDPSDPTAMATDAGVGPSDGGARDAGYGGGGDAGTSRTRGAGGMGSGSGAGIGSGH
jgi:hypothetical protein